MRQEVASEWPAGCGNHGCRIRKPTGMATNGPCKCPRIRLALIGEAPGQEEIEEGRPFIGAAGRTLDRLLRAANIARDTCFVGNIFSTKLENNDIASERVKQGPRWQEFETRNVERLAAEIAEVKPRLLVALGETPLRYLTGLGFNVSSVRGTLRPGAGRFADWQVFTCFHPAYILRVWKMFVPTVGDLCKANALASESGVIPKRKLNVEPNIKEVEEFLGGPCRVTKLLSVDIETAHKVGLVKGIAFAPNQTEAMYVPFVANTPSGSYWTSPDLEARAWSACKGVLESDVPKLGQNFGNYDLPWLFEKAGIYVKNFQEDLMLLHKVLFPELPASLEFMAGSYSEQGPWKAALRKSKDGKIED